MKRLLLGFLAAVSFAAHAGLGKPIESLPIQDGGRIKPYETFARESLQLIYGKRAFEGRSASEVVFTWLLIPDHWMTTKVVEINDKGVKDALKLEATEKFFSPQTLFTNERVALIFQELQSLRERQEKLNPYFQAVGRLENQLSLFQAIRAGVAMRFVPDPATDRWKAVSEIEGALRDSFVKVSKGFVDSVAAVPEGGKAQASPEFEASVKEFMDLARAQAPEKYADMTRIGWEVHLNHFQPFQWAWIGYLLGLLFMYFAAFMHQGWANRPGWLFLFLGWGLHAYGMAIRSYLAGRPPVTNMYETVVWVPFCCIFFGFILYRVQKSKLVLVCSSVIAIFCLILTNLAPTVLDGSIQPLEPVLRSTFWLTTHVLIITISYAAFFLAFGIGDVMLFYYLKDEEKYAEEIRTGTQSIYRAMQIGVVLVAAGTILGGVWADYSWGRFWGWDPKETWAFITLLGYVAVLHGRLVGWIKNFELAVAAIISFSLVLMCWYGVNFVLGAGLHSYGFGAGGVEYVAGFVVLHLLYVAYVMAVRYGRPKKVIGR